MSTETFRPSDDDIPICVQLRYTPHATRARYDDPRGIVQTVPNAFRKQGCKSYLKGPDGHYHVRYIYDDTADLELVINVIDGIGTVITLWLDVANNIGKNKGRFFLNTSKFTRNRVEVLKMANVR